MKQSITRLFGLVEPEDDQVKEIPINEIQPSPFQPRLIFDDERLDELCQTIQSYGLIQPIVVRRVSQGYELIAGERRWRAVQKLQLPTIPAIIRNMEHHEAASVALIENLQREGLSAIEEAHAYQKLLELHHITQENLAGRLGKSQSSIANKLRLLQLTDEGQQALFHRQITERHARALLTVKDSAYQIQILQEIIAQKLTVKQTEDRLKKKLKLLDENTKTKKPRKNFSRDTRIAMNTIRQSIQMVQESGLTVESLEEVHDQYVEVTIRIPR